MLRKKMSELAYRLKVRKALSDNSNDLLIITYEECKRLMEKRKIATKGI